MYSTFNINNQIHAVFKQQGRHMVPCIKTLRYSFSANFLSHDLSDGTQRLAFALVSEEI